MSSTPRRQRLRGRLGIDATEASPASSVLPPIQFQDKSPRYVSLAHRKQSELCRLSRAFQQRLDTTSSIVDLASLVDNATQDTSACTSEEDKQEEADGDDGDDCFSIAKRVVLTHTNNKKNAFLGQFINDMVATIERLVHEKRRQDAQAINSQSPPPQHTLPLPVVPTPVGSSPSTDNKDDGHEDCGDDSPASSEGESSSEGDGGDDSSKDQEQQEDQHADQPPVVTLATTTSVRNVQNQRISFRTSRRTRHFPPTRVPPQEAISTTCGYMPFDHLKKPPDLASLTMLPSSNNKSHTTDNGDGDHGDGGAPANQWKMVLFPKPKPSFHNHDELQGFWQWAAGAQHRQASDAAVAAPLHQKFQATLAIQELLCYELSRFLFDHCPTTARFLHGLFVEQVATFGRVLETALRQQQIMEQRHKNVALARAKLTDKLVHVETSVVSLKETLAKRQTRMLGERERIIRKRKKLSLILCADQILIRKLSGLLHHAQEIAEELTTGSHSSTTGQVATTTAASVDGVDRVAFTGVDELVAFVLDKYASLPPIARGARPRESGGGQTAVEAMQQTEKATNDGDGAPHHGQVIVLASHEIATAVEEDKATLLRLSRLVSTKSPDSSVGWDPRELWDQALFLPPHEEVRDLERDVQRLCGFVEAHILATRRRRASHDSVRHAAVQTEISACLPTTTANKTAAAATRIDDKPLGPKAWHWRSHARRQRHRPRSHPPSHHHHDEGEPPVAVAMPVAPSPPPSLAEDHRDLLRTVVPRGFKTLLREIPRGYTPHQLPLAQIHCIISYLLNSIWMLVQEDSHRPPRFAPSSTSSTSSSSTVGGGDGGEVIPLASIHEYLHRIYLSHFHIDSVVTSRLLDLLVSASRLDTQSCKVQLFCRLVGLPGVPPLSIDGFWFVLKALHVLQRCCGGTGYYFALDTTGENEFVPFGSASDAVGQLFAGSSNDSLKRLRLKLSGLASVFGTVWIPAYSVLTVVMDEWQAAQDALHALVREKLLLFLQVDDKSVSFQRFQRGFEIFQLHVTRQDALAAYRRLLQTTTGSENEDATSNERQRRFHVEWVELLVHVVNVAQQQMTRPHTATSASAPSMDPCTMAGPPPLRVVSTGVQLGAIADAMVTVNQSLAHKFLLANWHQMKPELLRQLDHTFHDLGLQVKLVHQIQAAIERDAADGSTVPPSPSPPGLVVHANPSAWSRFQQLLHIAYSTDGDASWPSI